EIENRAMRFLDQFGKQADCFTLHSPVELNDARRVQELFDSLGLKLRTSERVLFGRQNKNWQLTVITRDDRRQFREMVQTIPTTYLQIFRQEPYSKFSWVDALLP